MMPNMSQAVRSIGGRRVTCQVVTQTVVDFKAVQAAQSLQRATFVLTPMDPRKIAIKPEGQRTWKWWSAIGTGRQAKLELGWFLLPDRDGRIKYEVMTDADWSQASIYKYDFVETFR